MARAECRWGCLRSATNSSRWSSAGSAAARPALTELAVARSGSSHTERTGDLGEVAVERPYLRRRCQCAREQIHVDPTDTAPSKTAVPDERQNLGKRDDGRG